MSPQFKNLNSKTRRPKRAPNTLAVAAGNTATPISRGVWVMPIGEYEFLAMSDLHERQFQTFSQATTWLDGVYSGAEECTDLMRKTTH